MRDFSDPGEPDIFEQVEARERRERLKDVMALNEARAAQEAEAAEIRRARATRFSLETVERVLVREYESAGVRPPLTNGAGVPTVSLSLLLSIGWRIIEQSGERFLLKPPAQTEPPRNPRSDYDKNS